MATDAIREAAAGFLDLLDTPTRTRLTFPFESNEWRSWFNPHINVYRHGVMLEELSSVQRGAFLDLLRVTLSPRGYAQARDIMRLNELLAELTGRPDDFGEWPYFVSFFGNPSPDVPWGFQLDGHHLAIDCVAVGNELAMTPMFMGSERREGRVGRFAGFECSMSRSLLASISSGRSMWVSRGWDPIRVDHAGCDPSPLAASDRHLTQTAAFRDNAVVPYSGIRADGFSEAQRARLVDAITAYIGWTDDGHATVKMAEVVGHLDETWFAWMGGTGPTDPFYYRLHSPAVLIEFEHLPGVAFDNPEPSRHHIHTVIRTPNGGDYGADLLAEHHTRFNHQERRSG